MVFGLNSTSRKEIPSSPLNSLALKSRILFQLSSPPASASRTSKGINSDFLSRITGSRKQENQSESNYTETGRSESFHLNGFGKLGVELENFPKSNQLLDKCNGVSSQVSNYSNNENHKMEFCTNDDTEAGDIVTVDPFLCKQEANDRVPNHVRNTLHPLNQRPLSTSTRLSSTSLVLGGAGSDTRCVPTACNDIKNVQLRNKPARLSKSMSAETSCSNNRGKLSLFSYSSLPEGSNETTPSSLSSLRCAMEARLIATPLLNAHQADSYYRESTTTTSMCKSAAGQKKSNSNAHSDNNSSGAFSLFYASSLHYDDSVSATTVDARIDNNNSSTTASTLSFSKLRSKRKVKCKGKAGKTDCGTEISSQSAVGVCDRRSITADKEQKHKTSKRSYLYCMRKLKQFQQSLGTQSSLKKGIEQQSKLSLLQTNTDSPCFVTEIVQDSESLGKIVEMDSRENKKSNGIRRGNHPAIKITVSPDTPDSENLANLQQQLNAIKNSNIFGNNSEDNAFTLEDFTRLEFQNCVDFGITDFLCCKDEIDVDLSSDTDTSYIEATPPHRFSDSEMEQIEAMSITLDTALNLSPQTEKILINSTEILAKDGKNSTSAPPEMESSAGQELTDKDLILALKRLQARNLIKNVANNEKTLRKVLPKPFRRHISLPASVFMSYIFDQNNKTVVSPKESLSSISSTSHRNKRLPKIDSLSSGSNENIYDDSADNGLDSDSDWVSKSNSIDFDQADDSDTQAFTSDIEKRSLVVRHMRRRLVRQDTSGNFAPPDFCI